MQISEKIIKKADSITRIYYNTYIFMYYVINLLFIYLFIFIKCPRRYRFIQRRIQFNQEFSRSFNLKGKFAVKKRDIRVFNLE